MSFVRRPNPSRRFSDIHSQIRHPPSEEFYISRLSFDNLAESRTSRPRPRQNYNSVDARTQGDTIDHSDRHGTIRNLNLDGLTALCPSAEDDSDPEPSVYDISAFDFPEPPPMGTPVIRRMRSSPWFLHENEWDRDTVIDHWRSSIPVEPTTTLSRERGGLCPAISVPQKLNNEEGLGHFTAGYLDLEPFEDGLLAFDVHGFDAPKMYLGPYARNGSTATTEQPSSHPTPMFINNTQKGVLNTGNIKDKERRDSGEVKQETSNRPLSTLPRIIRKVASMRSDNPKVSQENYVPVSHGKTIPKSRSFRSILRPHETDQVLTLRGNARAKDQNMWTMGDDRVTSDSTNFVDGRMPFNTNQDSRQFKYPNSAHPSDHALDKRTSGYFPRDISIPDGLEAPFSQRKNPKSFTSTQVPNAAKSFMNITPKQGIKDKVGVQRDRVKNMVSRASSSWLGWGKRKTKTAPTLS